MIRLAATRKTTFPLPICTGEMVSIPRQRTVRRNGQSLLRTENHRTEQVLWLEKGGSIGPLPDAARDLPDVRRYQKSGLLVVLEAK